MLVLLAAVGVFENVKFGAKFCDSRQFTRRLVYSKNRLMLADCQLLLLSVKRSFISFAQPAVNP
ncbi:hypothetical protein T01_13178 [Trichinella spiralis]|uniref:Uncharacterized protein n=1 Tax=Trichinella spiralis TaxID=6334 RepID=A0A0V1BJZ5_TRISP|nr:hypothetical protein T01_13178 [Trichinella spiralis]